MATQQVRAKREQLRDKAFLSAQQAMFDLFESHTSGIGYITARLFQRDCEHYIVQTEYIPLYNTSLALRSSQRRSGPSSGILEGYAIISDTNPPHNGDVQAFIPSGYLEPYQNDKLIRHTDPSVLSASSDLVARDQIVIKALQAFQVAVL